MLLKIYPSARNHLAENMPRNSNSGLELFPLVACICFLPPPCPPSQYRPFPPCSKVGRVLAMCNYSLEHEQDRYAAVISTVASNGSCLLIPISIGTAACDATRLSVWADCTPETPQPLSVLGVIFRNNLLYPYLTPCQGSRTSTSGCFSATGYVTAIFLKPHLKPSVVQKPATKPS